MAMDIHQPQPDHAGSIPTDLGEDPSQAHAHMLAYYEEQIARYTQCVQDLQHRHAALVAREAPTALVNGNTQQSRLSCVSDVTDAQWERIEPLLPPLIAHGRPRADRRRTLDGILYVLTTPCA